MLEHFPSREQPIPIGWTTWTSSTMSTCEGTRGRTSHITFEHNHINQISHSKFPLTISSSVVQLTQLAMPHLERAKGNVISVSSCLALRQAMDAYFYGMLKAAMDHWTRGMAQKWGPRGVRFNCIKSVRIRNKNFRVINVAIF